MAGLVPVKLAYRAVDNDSGAEVVPRLPHLGGQWTVRALQRGMAGAASLGDFKIQIPGLYTAEGSRYRSQILSLAKGQRIEASFGDEVTEAPNLSGIITTDPRITPDGVEITGMDTLWLLQQSQTLQGEFGFEYPWLGRNLVRRFTATQETQWDDDFAGWSGTPGKHPSSDYHSSGFTFTAADPYLGQPAMTSTTTSPTVACIVSNTSWAIGSGPFTWSSIRATGTIVAGTDTGTAGELSLFFLADGGTPPANGVMCSAILQQTGAGSGVWRVVAQIYSISGGVYTLQSSQTVFPSVGTHFPCQVTAIIYYQGSIGGFATRVLVNGKDSNCVWANAGFIGSGRVGVRHSPNAAGGPSVYVNNLTFRGRTAQYETPSYGTNRFQAGTQSTGALLGGQPVPGQSFSHLDLVNLAAALDNFEVRKNAGYGYKADTIDYAPQTGTDLSSAVVLEEGVNITSIELAPSSSPFSRDLRLLAVPGNDSGGSIVWERIGNAGDLVIVDTLADVGIPSFQLLMAQVRLAQARAMGSLRALQVTIARTADVADKFRELDFVLVHYPSLSIFQQREQVVGYSLVEGSDEQTVWLSEFPDRSLLAAALRRITGPIEFIGNYVVR